MRSALNPVLFRSSAMTRILRLSGLQALYDPSDLTSLYASRTGGEAHRTEARRNLLTYTEAFDNAAWLETIAGSGASPVRTANAGPAPDGTLTADRLQFSLGGGTATADQSYIAQTVAITQTSTISIWLKSNTGSNYAVYLRCSNTSETITVTPTWQRFSVVGAVSPGTVQGFGLRGGQSVANSDTADILAWGAQEETGSTATTYQPVLAATYNHVDSVVGIMLDKSEMGGKTAAAFIEGQSNTFLYGSFDSGTGWTFNVTGANTCSITGGVLSFVTTGADICTATSANAVTVDQWYEISFDVAEGSSGTLKLLPIGNGGEIAFTCTPGRKTFVGRAQASSSLSIARVVGQVADADIDNIVIKHIPGYSTLAPSDAARGILARVPATGRRNLFTYSEAFDNAAWTKTNSAVVAATDPDGGSTAFKITENDTAAGTQHDLRQNVTLVAGATHAISIYAKAGSGTNRIFRVYCDGGSSATSVKFDLSNGTIYTEAIASGSWTGQSSTITAVGNGWYRCTLTWTATTDAGTRVVYWLNDASGITTYDGDGVSHLYLWRVQAETASSVTAYQKVVSARDVTEAGVADRYYLDLDGTDDWMNVFPTLNLGEQWWCVLGMRHDAVTAHYPFALSNQAGGKGALLISSSKYNWRNAADSNSALNTTNPTSAHVLTVEDDANIAARYNGVAESAAFAPFDDSAAAQGLALFSAFNNSYSNGMDGRFYGGAFGTGAITPTERTLLERYVAGLSGVTL